MRVPATIPLALAVLATALSIAGCGGGGSESTSSGGGAADVAARDDGLTDKAKFIQQADTLCRRSSAIIHDGIQPYMEEGLEAVETRAVAGGMVHDVVAPDLEAQVVAISALDWPAGAGGEVGAFLHAIEDVAENGREDPVELILHHGRAIAPARRLAEAYGFSDCGRLRIVPPEEDGEAQERESASKAEFIERADGLCRKAVAVVQAVLQPYVMRGLKFIKRPAVVRKMGDDVVALELEAEFGGIGQLDRPAGDGKEIEAFLSAIEEVADNGRKDPAELIFHTRRAFASARKLAEAYGFSYCGRFWIILPNANSEARMRPAMSRNAFEGGADQVSTDHQEML